MNRLLLKAFAGLLFLFVAMAVDRKIQL